jgi:8-oxo-dGTP diphosphatase
MMQRQFPNLFAPAVWLDTLEVQFSLLAEPPEDQYIANVNVVPYVGSQWVVVQTQHYPEMPGGTREPDEPYAETLRRELLEEAGGQLLDYQPLGAWYCVSRAEKPYRSHMPHPAFYRYVVTGEVELVTAPSSPPGGETILSVDVVSLAEAVQRFILAGRVDIAELYQLAALVRRNSSSQ